VGAASTAIGIRMALLRITAALGMTHVLATLLYGVTPIDVITFATAAMTLAAVALVACLVPASRPATGARAAAPATQVAAAPLADRYILITYARSKRSRTRDGIRDEIAARRSRAR